MTDKQALARLEALRLRHGGMPTVYFDDRRYHVEVPFSDTHGAERSALPGTFQRQ
jgi:hypothetical protein